MALVKCKECEHEISKKADVCPNCGFKREKTGFITWIILIIFFSIIIGNIGSDKPKLPPKPLTVEEEMDNKRVAAVMVNGEALKKSLREPNSVEWMEIFVNKEATRTCFVYRAKNGFGGVSIERTVLFFGQIFNEKNAWNKYCTKDMYNLTRAKNAIR
jgi:RNA polymerase subunit RPABC4/transcription elongation factor Spt4